MKKSLAQLRRKADRLVQIVPPGSKCLVCGQPAQVKHHFVPKSQSHYLRYHPDNLVLLCHPCHFRHHTAGDPQIIAAIVEKKGFDWAHNLGMKRSIICKFTIGYLGGVINELEDND